jgi:hypothetical protein
MQQNQTISKVMNWPPLVDVIAGVFLLAIWAGGTAVQVLTSEAWFAHTSLVSFNVLAAYRQLWDFVHGDMPTSMLAPFMFAWGTQAALIVASIGIELPKHPEWRYKGAWALMWLLIAVNSAGDYNSTESYGFWGQIGFTIVVLFATFVVGLLAVMCFVRAAQKVKA